MHPEVLLNLFVLLLRSLFKRYGITYNNDLTEWKVCTIELSRQLYSDVLPVAAILEGLKQIRPKFFRRSATYLANGTNCGWQYHSTNRTLIAYDKRLEAKIKKMAVPDYIPYKHICRFETRFHNSAAICAVNNNKRLCFADLYNTELVQHLYLSLMKLLVPPSSDTALIKMDKYSEFSTILSDKLQTSATQRNISKTVLEALAAIGLETIISGGEKISFMDTIKQDLAVIAKTSMASINRITSKLSNLVPVESSALITVNDVLDLIKTF